MLTLRAEVVAINRDVTHMRHLAANMQRLGFALRTVLADGTDWNAERDFNIVFLNAPCSASGTVPMASRYHLATTRAHDAQYLPLGNAVSLLKPGRIRIYSVCSIRPAEGPSLMA